MVLVAGAAGEAAPLADKEFGPALPVAIGLGEAVDLPQVRLQGAALREALVAAEAAAVRADACRQRHTALAKVLDLTTVRLATVQNYNGTDERGL